jgi:hypothetical protein
VDAILIGVAITVAIFLGGWGIVSARGNPVESSLLVWVSVTLVGVKLIFISSPT